LIERQQNWARAVARSKCACTSCVRQRELPKDLTKVDPFLVSPLQTTTMLWSGGISHSISTEYRPRQATFAARLPTMSHVHSSRHRPGRRYMITRRCSERRFFMRPDRETNNAFIYCLALAARKASISIVCVGTLSNHYLCRAAHSSVMASCDLWSWRCEDGNSGAGAGGVLRIIRPPEVGESHASKPLAGKLPPCRLVGPGGCDAACFMRRSFRRRRGSRQVA